MSPYPAGKHGPGHYIPGAGGNLIFLRDVADWYIQSADGSNVNIDLPVRQPNDDLFVFVNQLFEQVVLPVGWTQIQSNTVAGIVGAVRLFHRVATNDANDNFLIPTSTSATNRVAQMASFGNTDPMSPPDFLVLIQGGPVFDTTGIVLTFAAITAGADPSETFILFLATHFRLSETGAVTTPANLEGNLEEIDSLSINAGVPPSDNRINITWSWDYQDVSVSVPGGTIAYTAQQFGANFSQYTRWHLE